MKNEKKRIRKPLTNDQKRRAVERNRIWRNNNREHVRECYREYCKDPKRKEERLQSVRNNLKKNGSKYYALRKEIYANNELVREDLRRRVNEYRANNIEAVVEKEKVKLRHKVDNLTDSYIIGILITSSKNTITAQDIPLELIEMKRANILLKRAAKT